MNNLYRSLISLATVFPLSITFSYLYSDWLLSLLPDVVSHFLEAHLNAQLVFVLCAVVFWANNPDLPRVGRDEVGSTPREANKRQRAGHR